MKGSDKYAHLESAEMDKVCLACISKYLEGVKYK